MVVASKPRVQYGAILLTVAAAVGLIMSSQLAYFQSNQTQIQTQPETETTTTNGLKFEDVTRVSGLGHIIHHKPVLDKKLNNIMPWMSSMGAAVAAADYDRNGLIDIYLTDSGQGYDGHLMHNLGGMQFEEIPGTLSGLISPNVNSATMDAAWGDYNNDGWPDLYLVKWGCNQLFHNNGDGTFSDVTAKTTVGDCGNGNAAIWLDFNRDGCLDLYVSNYFREINLWNLTTTKIMHDDFESAQNGGANLLYRNNCDATFTNIAAQAGVADTGWSLDVASADVNLDGWLDIFVSNDFGADKLFINLGDDTFKDTSNAAIGFDTKKSMNAEFADINGDSCPDLYVTAITKEGYLVEGNSLWINKCDGTFYNIAHDSGVWDGGWGWAGKMADYDNDGDTDIFTVNGFISAGKDNYWFKLGTMATTPGLVIEDAANWPPIGNLSLSGYETSRFFLNQGNLRFTNIAEMVGVNDNFDGRGAAVADFDNDGDLDILVANQGQPPVLYENKLKLGNWVLIYLIGKSPSNVEAMGAQVKLTAGNNTRYAMQDGSGGFASQSDPRIHIGLGNATRIDSLEITWPDGRTQVMHNLGVNRIYNFNEAGV